MMMFKAFLRKQWGLIGMVSLMVVMLLLSTQVLMTHQLKHQTMVDRVISTNSPQIMIHVHDMRIIYYLEEAIERYNLEVEVDARINFESTMIFNTRKNNFDILFEVLTPTHVNSLPLLEGKSLSEIGIDEAAIVQSYANELRSKGIDPFSHTLVLNTSEGEKSFKIVSIVDYPNYNDPYIPDNGLKGIPLFDFPYPSTALILEDQLIGVQTAETTSEFFGETITTTNYASGVSKAYHLRFDEYTLEKERVVMNHLYRTFGAYTDDITFYPIYEYADYLSTNEQLYSMIARYGLWLLSLLSALGLLVLLRQQFLQNIKTLGLLITLGHSYVRVSLILVIRFVLALVIGLVLWLSLNASLYPFIQANRELAKIIDQTSLILWTSGLSVALAFSVWVSISGYLSVRSLRFAHSSIRNQRKNTIKAFPIKKHWKVNVAIKGMLSRLSFTSIMIVLLGLIIASATSFLLISHQVSSIYNEETLGVKFDYIVLDAPFSHYETTGTIAESQVWVQKLSNYLFVDVHYSKNYFNYYKSSVLFFMANMEGYVEPIEGTLPEDLRDSFREWKYNIRETMASRKQMEKTNSFVYSVEMVQKEKSAERGYLFISAISASGLNKEQAAQIKGTMNTLIDQGWIAYVYRDQLMVEVAVPYLEMYLFNMADGVTQEDAEALMDAQGIKYMAFDEVTSILNDVNKVTQAQTLVFILTAVSLLVGLLLIVTAVYFKTMKLEQVSNQKLLTQLGLPSRTLNQMHVAQIGFVWISGLIIASISLPIVYQRMLDEMLQAYGLYTTTPINQLAISSIGILTVLFTIGVLAVYAYNGRRNPINK
jgi:hypothetical protein